MTRLCQALGSCGGCLNCTLFNPKSSPPQKKETLTAAHFTGGETEAKQMSNLPETGSEYTKLIFNQGNPDYTSSNHDSRLMRQKIFKPVMLRKPRGKDWLDVSILTCEMRTETTSRGCYNESMR